MEEGRYCRAAKDGYLDVLMEATRRDCNSSDEDGMTPTLWASHEGHLDALRLIVGRGGDPDKCDNYGNTALHCSAAMGHLNCVSFLVNFGASLWALDNDLHSAKDLAAIRGRDDVLQFLDSAIAKQQTVNKKTVRVLKDKAIREAEKRIKEFDRLQKKLDKKVVKEESRQSQHRSAAEERPGGIVSTISRNTASLLSRGRRPGTVASQTNPSFSDLTLDGSGGGALTSAVGRRAQRHKLRKQPQNNEFTVSDIENGNRTVRSLSGLKRDDQILYMPRSSHDHTRSSHGHQRSNREYTDEWNSRLLTEPSLFDRPGFGSVAFRTNMSSSLSRLSVQNTAEPPLEEDRRSMFTAVREDSIGSANSLAEKPPLWHDVDSPSDDDAEDSDPDLAALHLFLTATGVAEFIPNFARERIDLAALSLLDDGDLAALGLPLGPRRKLLKAVEERRAALHQPGRISDTNL